MDAAKIQLYKDNDDLIIVVKNSGASIEELILNMIKTSIVKEIPAIEAQHDNESGYSKNEVNEIKKKSKTYDEIYPDFLSEYDENTDINNGFCYLDNNKELTNLNQFDSVNKKEQEYSNDKQEWDNVQVGKYLVSIDKVKIEKNKNDKDMLKIRFKIIDDTIYKNRFLYMNQIITKGYATHIIKSFLRDLLDEDIEFNEVSELKDKLDNILNKVNNYYYNINYSINYKGFSDFKIIDKTLKY